MNRPVARPSLRGKNTVVAAYLNGREGRVLDLGARDGILGTRLANTRLTYVSADRAPGADIRVDLERPLDLPDRAYDHVVALDVLEHIGEIHAAFRELARVAAATCIIALPHMGNWRQRAALLWTGRFATKKYDLPPTPPSDRHRWFTIRTECDRFIEGMAESCGWSVVRIVRELEGSIPVRMAGFIPVRLGICVDLLVGRSIYFLERAER